jgi:hypothetical protein
MASNIDLDACYELVMQLVNQGGEVNIEEQCGTRPFGYQTQLWFLVSGLTQFSTENGTNQSSSH